MNKPYDFAAVCKALADDAVPVTAEWHRRLAEGPQPVLSKGRLMEDSDPKRGATSPLGGKVW
jgi:hypothetical protein